MNSDGIEEPSSEDEAQWQRFMERLRRFKALQRALHVTNTDDPDEPEPEKGES